MTTKHWLGTAAAVLAFGTISASAMAQGQPEMRREGERGAPAQAAPRETGRPAAAAESKAGAAAERATPDLKQSAKEGEQGATSRMRDQAESRDSKLGTAQKNAEQPSRGERDQSAQREGRETNQTAKDAAEPKQKQGAAEERKGDTKTDSRAAETNKTDGNKSAQSGQRGDREADRHDRNPAGTAQQSQDERKSRGGEQANDKQPGNERTNQAAQPTRPDTNNTAAQQNTQPDARGQRDAAGQAQANRGRSSTTVSVNDQQRTRVFDQLHRDRDFDQARTDINIRVNVGERLPERVRPRRLPDDIVTIVPEYRGYDYTVVNDEIAIVDPRSREIVDVIPQGGVTADRGYGVDRTRIVLSDDQRQILRRAATSSGTVGSTVSSSSGSSGPTCLSLQRVPDEIARSNPELASYQYLAIGDQVVLIDPQNQKVVQVIDQQQQQQ